MGAQPAEVGKKHERATSTGGHKNMGAQPAEVGTKTWASNQHRWALKYGRPTSRGGLGPFIFSNIFSYESNCTLYSFVTHENCSCTICKYIILLLVLCRYKRKVPGLEKSTLQNMEYLSLFSHCWFVCERFVWKFCL